jgi:hypothetical protein
MKKKHKNLYLYLTLVCFVGIILIFIFDGYMGVYDTLSVTAGEYPDKIEADRWPEEDRYWPTSVDRGSKVDFSYEVDNRWFSTYTADVEVSLWHEQEQVAVLLAQPISVASFEKESVEWTLDTAELVPADFPAEQRYDFTVILKRGEIERNILVHVREAPYELKPVIIEPSR